MHKREPGAGSTPGWRCVIENMSPRKARGGRSSLSPLAVGHGILAGRLGAGNGVPAGACVGVGWPGGTGWVAWGGWVAAGATVVVTIGAIIGVAVPGGTGAPGCTVMRISYCWLLPPISPLFFTCT